MMLMALAGLGAAGNNPIGRRRLCARVPADAAGSGRPRRRTRGAEQAAVADRLRREDDFKTAAV